jgi:hypothetical protein
MSTTSHSIISEDTTVFIITLCRTSNLAILKKFVSPVPHVLSVSVFHCFVFHVSLHEPTCVPMYIQYTLAWINVERLTLLENH